VDVIAIAVAALFHDVSEVLTYYLPTPVKYHHASLTQAYWQIEAKARLELTGLLPKPLQAAYAPLLKGMIAENSRRLLKAADHLSAYLKCLREMRWGNLEFQGAAQRLEAKLDQCDLPEVKVFLQLFVPDCALPLDHLLEINNSNECQQVFVEG